MRSNNNKSSSGLPHSEIHGSKPIPGSPWLIAGYHVLHRLLLPRHPPNALIALDSTRKEQGRAPFRQGAAIPPVESLIHSHAISEDTAVSCTRLGTVSCRPRALRPKDGEPPTRGHQHETDVSLSTMSMHCRSRPQRAPKRTTQPAHPAGSMIRSMETEADTPPARPGQRLLRRPSACPPGIEGSNRSTGAI